MPTEAKQQRRLAAVGAALQSDGVAAAAAEAEVLDRAANPGSHRTPSWHPVEDSLDPLQIGKVP
jgi:hypothetical protein